MGEFTTEAQPSPPQPIEEAIDAAVIFFL